MTVFHFSRAREVSMTDTDDIRSERRSRCRRSCMAGSEALLVAVGIADPAESLPVLAAGRIFAPRPVLGDRCLDPDSRHPRSSTSQSAQMAAAHRDNVIAALQDDRYYRWCTYLFVPLQYAGLVFAAWCWAYAPMATGEKIALAMTVGVVAGVGINAAHELGHKSSRLERRLAKIVLAQSFYGALLHRAQSRSPRQRCDAARSRQCSFRGIVLDILAPQRIRRSEIGLADRISTPAPAGFTRTVASKQHRAGMVAERRTVR